MKTTLLSLFLAPFVCFGQADIWWSAAASVPKASGGTPACSTPDWGDIIDEGFQGTGVGYENTWTTNVTDAAINPAYDISSLTTGFYTNLLCSKGCLFTVPTDGVEEAITWDNGSVIDLDTVATDVTFWFYLTSLPSEGKLYRFAEFRQAASFGSDVAAGLQIETSSGNTTVQAFGGVTSTKAKVSSGEWYKLSVHLDTTAASCVLYTNGVQVSTFTRNSPRDFRYMTLGPYLLLDANDDGAFIIDLISVNTP